MKHKINKPNLTGWGFDAMDRLSDQLEKGIREVAAEALYYAFNDDDTYIYFPIEWCECNSDGYGGPAVQDPLTVYLNVALDDGSFDKPVIYEFNLRSALQGSMETCAEDGSYATGLSRLSASLRELADEIDRAVTSSKDLQE